MAKITLGPIIGKVTETTARVLIEIDSATTVTCVITDTTGNVLNFNGKVLKNRPFVFRLTGLQPNMKYKVSFTGVDSNFPIGRIRTFDANANKMNIAAVSCNAPVRNGSTDLWQDLLDRYVMPNDVDLLIHIGDQVYGDGVFTKSKRIINENIPPGKKIQDAKIKELYRDLYRSWWSIPATRKVLANVSNLMIWDDHDIRDDWGSLSEDFDKSSVEFRIGTLARQVYREYQRQLWDDFDIDSLPANSDEHHHHSWGQIGILFLDQRSGRSFGRDAARPYLGTRQWNFVENQLKTGDLSKVRALIVVTSVPLVYLGGNITTLGSNIPIANDLLDHWSHTFHQKEQIEMIRALREWKAAKNGQRELLVVGGDVHIGGNTEVKHLGATIFKQLITSPITNQPPKLFLFAGLKILAETEQNLSESYSYEHSNLTNKRNYGIVVVRVPNNGLPKVEGSLVKEP